MTQILEVTLQAELIAFFLFLLFIWLFVTIAIWIEDGEGTLIELFCKQGRFLKALSKRIF